jgi:hypothetical protein
LDHQHQEMSYNWRAFLDILNLLHFNEMWNESINWAN